MSPIFVPFSFIILQKITSSWTSVSRQNLNNFIGTCATYIHYILFIKRSVNFLKCFLFAVGLIVQSCMTLCDPVDCSLPDSSVQGSSLGVNTGVGCHALLQGTFPTQGSNPGLPCCRRILYQLSYLFLIWCYSGAPATIDVHRFSPFILLSNSTK